MAPGLFAYEALANFNALLTSADPYKNPFINPGFKDCWLVTYNWSLYDKLKYLLTHRAVAYEYAHKGYYASIKYNNKNYAAHILMSNLKRIS